ncbi:hypothetical protein K438DRAFT_967177 [Mycena galopus ATCC 62051]|nr:hypothetical protein K438DRAFT_967177 [Mycena galopus ATCC 62051]
MFSDRSEHPVPFLGHPPATSELEHLNVDADEKPFHRDTSGHRRIPRQPRRKSLSWQFLSKLMGWPAIVICGQLILQAVAWGFFLVVQRRGGISLPHRLAASAKANPHIVEWISTQIATILAFFSTLLFSWGIRGSITLHLRGDGMSFAAFISFIKISTRSLILNPRRRILSLMSIVILILTGVQTAGWSALITPRPVVISTPLTGHDIDLSSPLLRQMLGGNEVLDSCVVASTSLAAFMVGQTESGYTAVQGDLGFPATFTMMDQPFNLSTAGISPLTLSPLNASTWFPNITTIPATVKPVWELPDGLDSSYSLSQQGFTADVSCKYGDSPDNTVPTLFFENNTVKDWTNPRIQSGDITHFRLSSDCVADDNLTFNVTEAYTLANQPNYLLMIACPSRDNYQLIFYGGPIGLYNFMETTVCTVSPKITNVEVDYSHVINARTKPDGTLADIAAPPTLSAVNTLFDMVYFSQAIATNSMGDKLRALITEADDKTLSDSTILRNTEEYIRGVTEYSTSVFRACLSINKDALPSNLSVSTNGTFYTETIGWIHTSVTLLELIPGTIVAILTIYTVVMAVAKHAGDEKGVDFDPTDATHLVAASAAGGLNNVFVGTKEEDIRAVEDGNIYLSTIPGRGPALVRGTP